MHREAIRHLRRVDQKLALVIDRVGPCTLQAASDGSHFHHLLRAIVYQQLSGKAAATIFGRVVGLFENGMATPDALVAVPETSLRSAGLSGQKTAYVRDLAAKIISGELPVDDLDSLPDAGVSQALLRVKGVGVWTAQMFLMFRLGRLDVLPGLDLGVRKGLQYTHGLRSLPTPDQVQRIGRQWSPYSSIAAWYLWRSLELPDARRKVAAPTPAAGKKLAKGASPARKQSAKRPTSAGKKVRGKRS